MILCKLSKNASCSQPFFMLLDTPFSTRVAKKLLYKKLTKCKKKSSKGIKGVHSNLFCLCMFPPDFSAKIKRDNLAILIVPQYIQCQGPSYIHFLGQYHEQFSQNIKFSKLISNYFLNFIKATSISMRDVPWDYTKMNIWVIEIVYSMVLTNVSCCCGFQNELNFICS